MAKWDIGLSHHKLKFLVGEEACPRCFYDHCKLKLERPKGIFPSLPNGMDDRLKTYFDRFRGSLPPILKGLIPGVLWGAPGEIARYRHWNSNTKPLIPTPYGTVGLINAFDDLIERHDRFISPLDYKTRGSVPLPGYAELYYQAQADLYHVHLKVSQQLTPHPETYFVIVSPQEVDAEYDLPDGLPMKFDVTMQMVVAHYDDGMDLITEGAKILSQDKRPDPGIRCGYCSFVEARKALEGNVAHRSCVNADQ